MEDESQPKGQIEEEKTGDGAHPEGLGQGRPRITQYASGHKFRVGDIVYLTRSDGNTRGLEGPFLISGVHDAARYTLSLADGQPWENGSEVSEDQLEFAP